MADALDQAEDDVQTTVADVLDEVAAEFARSVENATELVAARFSVSRIASMFTDRMPRIVRKLLGVAETAVEQAAADVGTDPPEGWENLPDRYDDDTLPAPMSDYVKTTEHLLRAAGDRLAEAARQELADGVDAGEDIDQLRDRIAARFAREGTQLGPGRERLIARTEAARAWNTGTLEAGRALSGPDRPIVKQWRTRGDSLVRDPHRKVDGQLRLLDEPFNVGRVEMQAPGDPSAPPELTCNCRCRLVLEKAPANPTAAAPAPAVYPGVDADRAAILAAWDNTGYQRPVPVESQASPAQELSDQRPTWMEEMDAVIQRRLAAVGVPDADRYQLVYDASPLPVLANEVQAAAVQHTGAMIALVPTEEDAQRLALDDGEPADELHLTLWYLGEGVDWGEEQRRELIGNMLAAASQLAPFTARAFGVNHWNPASDSPSWVWAVGENRDAPDDATTLQAAHNAATHALEDGHNNPELPVPHSPWSPHVCGVYTAEPWPLAEMAERVGEITFDRLRVAFAGERTDIPLGPAKEEEETMPDQLMARPWSTPGTAAIAFEDEETGDGRVFSPGALQWDQNPMPLQYADEMLMGHEGAELAGAVQAVIRDGGRITAAGVLYAGRPAGLDAIQLLEEAAPLGVSVDLDDVDIEFVDKTLSPEDADWLFASARMPSASVLRMEDGSLMLSGATVAEWTASQDALSRSRYDLQLITGPAGILNASAIQHAFAGTGILTAAAGDTDDPDKGLVVHAQKAGEFVMRITRARLRGATLVAVPAFRDARIVLDPAADTQASASVSVAPVFAATGSTRERVVMYVCSSPAAVGARDVAGVIGIAMTTARNHLSAAAKDKQIIRLAPGLFCGPSTMPEGTETASADPDAELLASAWQVLQDMPAMPAPWFAMPTREELPPGSKGVHYDNGRVFGWVAQAGEPHAGMPGRNLTIESLGRLDLTHFLRQEFALDNGATVRAGAMTMNVGHHRDGAECETSACQFDDSRTVGAVVTVGMNEGGLWFSGAGAPWLSEWDRTVFQACQPSYHMKQGGDGRWQLRAVLSVPVPGHSSPLLAAAVQRSNLALAASAAVATDSPDTVSGQDQDTPDTLSGQEAGQGVDLPGQRPDTVSGHSPDSVPALTEALASALTSPAFLDRLAAAVDDRARDRADTDAEIARLAAQFDPTAEELAASLVGDRPKENV